MADQTINMARYAPRHSDALCGQEFLLEMDDGFCRSLRFISPGRLIWVQGEVAGAEVPCSCLDAGNGVWFVTFDLCPQPRENLTLVLDIPEGLVTLVQALQGRNPKRPTAIDVKVLPGAVRRPEGLNPRRHGYSAELVGKAIRWQYSEEFSIIHIYPTEHSYRIKLLQKLGDPDSPYEVAMRHYVDRTEPAFYVRIREGLMLFGFVEDNMDKVTGPEISCASRLQLINTKSMMTLGRGFAAPGTPLELFGAVGHFEQLPEEDFAPGSIYTV